MTPGVPMGEPLLPKGTRGKVLSAVQAPQDAEEVVVEFAWPREATEEDQDRCFAVVSVGDAHLDVAAMALQGMVGPSPARTGPRDAQMPAVQGVQAASNVDWVVEGPAKATTQQQCRLIVSLRNPAGLPAVPSAHGQSRDVRVQLFDFGTVPPTSLSEPLHTHLVLP